MHAGNSGSSQRYANNGASMSGMTSAHLHSVTQESGMNDNSMTNNEDGTRTSPPASMRKSGSRLLDQMPPIEASPGRSDRAFRSGNEKLYEAYNDLHSLAQDFEKPFDAPAILVVGHQTEWKIR